MFDLGFVKVAVSQEWYISRLIGGGASRLGENKHTREALVRHKLEQLPPGVGKMRMPPEAHKELLELQSEQGGRISRKMPRKDPKAALEFLLKRPKGEEGYKQYLEDKAKALKKYPPPHSAPHGASQATHSAPSSTAKASKGLSRNAKLGLGGTAAALALGGGAYLYHKKKQHEHQQHQHR